MHFVIISAGEGERLRTEGIKTSKPLIIINGIPLIERLIKIAIKSGANKISCIINEQATDVKDFFDNNKFDISINLKIKSTPSSLHSLFELKPFINEDYFCLSTVDTIFDENEFLNFINFATSHQNYDGVLSVTHFIDDEKPLCVDLNSENRILGFYDDKKNHTYATGGIYFFSTKIFNEMDFAIKNNFSRLRNFLKHLISKDYNLYAYPFTKIIDVDHIKDIQEAEKFIGNF